MRSPLELCAFSAAIFVVFAVPGRASNTDELKKFQAEAVRDRSSKEGYHYETQFDDAIDGALNKATESCSTTMRNTDPNNPASVVFVVAGDGRITNVLCSNDSPFARCLSSKLVNLPRAPRPPHDQWAIAMDIHNRRHGPPPDKPRKLRGEDEIAAMHKAVAPYIAKARATYPAAKQRFLAGLPEGYKFAVRVPLFDRNGDREDAFIEVERIRGGNITGRIGSALGTVREYKQGQQITFPENKIDNWVIVGPDGTEEGNYVGKFLDHYKPQ